MSETDFTFPSCMHRLAAGMHMEGIDPSDVTISLPPPKWWNLLCAIDRRSPGRMPFDGRGSPPTEFRYMGFRFIARAGL